MTEPVEMLGDFDDLFGGARSEVGPARPRVALPRLSTAERIDPYWDGLWVWGSQAGWVSWPDAKARGRAGLARVPADLRGKDLDLDFAALPPSTRGRLSALMGVADQWRTATVEQASALTGWDRLDPQVSRLFRANVLDVGAFSSPLLDGPQSSRARLIRPSHSKAFDRSLAPQMSLPENVAITGGLDWSVTHQFDRHNLLTLDLALRAGEFCEITAALGDKLSTADLLAWSGAGRTGRCPWTHGADATLIRPDGLRIAVELTASVGAQFRKKAALWANTLANTPMSTSGLVVVFVAAPPPTGSKGRALWPQIRKEVARAVTEQPGSAVDRTADRMFVAQWRDWFPARHEVASSFTTLEVESPTGPAGDERWERRTLLDRADVPFRPADPDRALAAGRNAGLLWGNPYWLRDPGAAPPLWPVEMARAGFDAVPVAQPQRPHRSTGVRAAQARAGVGVTQPPPRLDTWHRTWPTA